MDDTELATKLISYGMTISNDLQLIIAKIKSVTKEQRQEYLDWVTTESNKRHEDKPSLAQEIEGTTHLAGDQLSATTPTKDTTNSEPGSQIQTPGRTTETKVGPETMSATSPTSQPATTILHQMDTRESEPQTYIQLGVPTTDAHTSPETGSSAIHTETVTEIREQPSEQQNQASTPNVETPASEPEQPPDTKSSSTVHTNTSAKTDGDQSYQQQVIPSSSTTIIHQQARPSSAPPQLDGQHSENVWIQPPTMFNYPSMEI